MKRLLALFIFLFFLLCTYAQDIIITSSYDTIECSIKLVKPDFIYYTINVNNEFRTVSIPVNSVVSYKYVFSEQTLIPAEKQNSYRDFERLRLSLNGGYGYQLGKIKKDITPEITEYQQKLKSGYQFGGNLTYFFSSYFGLGVEYRGFWTSNSKDNVRLVDKWGYPAYGKMSDDINISLYTLIFTTRTLRLTKRDSFYATYGLGYIGFRDKATALDNYLMTGGTVGMSTEIGYDIGLTESWRLGFQLTYIMGLVKEYRLDDGSRIQTIDPEEEDDYINLYRLDFSVGIRYNF